MRAAFPAVLRAGRVLAGDWHIRTLVVALTCVLMAGLSVLALASRAAAFEVTFDEVSVGDGMLWLWMGHPSGLSAAWVALACMVLATSLVDARAPVRGMAAFPYVQIGSRSRGWLACCLVVSARAILACLGLMACDALVIVAVGGAPGLDPMSIDALSMGAVSAGAGTGDVAAFIALVFMGFVALGLLQLVLCLVCGPFLGFGISMVVLFASALVPLLPLPGSWLMASRVQPFGTGVSLQTNSWSLGAGLVLFGVSIVALVMLGRALFSRCDLSLGGERR